MLDIVINLDYLKSWNGIFKILQLVVGTICIGIIGHEFNSINVSNALYQTALNFYLIVTCTFFIGTFILVISYLMSPSAASIVPKTVYEFIYQSIASLLLLVASITLMVKINQANEIASYKQLLVAS
ncbi:uncharacterized protein LOC105433525, partial [Pogonomyrmex barbatus]|uniref:Uncharacterized protein LOC105433525 n=1 Tax=Pogonomyrmex barbatus TaxID=144034 RepID=A0A6I9WV21_9HYME